MCLLRSGYDTIGDGEEEEEEKEKEEGTTAGEVATDTDTI